MISRKIKKTILARLNNFPAVALLGPRQAGKTTLAKTFSKLYYDLEIEQDRLRLDIQWEEIIVENKIIILDEAQNYPEVFPRIRNAIDNNRKKNGRFLILGSVSPGLMQQVSEFLTGRIALCEISPLAIEEITKKDIDKLWLRGGFPDGGILDDDQFPVWQRNYLDLLAMRDLPHWGLSAKPQVISKFFKMMAAVHGGLWNASQIGKSMGLSYHTVNSYLDYLDQVYIIRKLNPYFSNLKKRLVKSNKIYWRDSGLLHSLLNINDFSELISQPWVGMSWEGFVIEQVLNSLDSRGRQYEAYFLRTSDGYELDLVLILGNKKWAFEIKLTGSPGNEDMNRLIKTSEMINADNAVLISRTKKGIKGKNLISTNVAGILTLLSEH
jgi:predicted AAA+ superfamily ATPase